MGNESTKRGRGRPKKAETVELERIQNLLDNPPPYIPKLTEEQREWFRSFLESSEQVKQKILKDHGHMTSQKLIYELESIWSALPEEARLVVKIYADHVANLQSARQRGAKDTEKNAKTKAEKLWSKNEYLANKIRSGAFSLSQASQIIHDSWNIRGIEGDPPTVRTISNWYNITYRK